MEPTTTEYSTARKVASWIMVTAVMAAGLIAAGVLYLTVADVIADQAKRKQIKPETTVVEVEPEINPITLPQALALLEDPQDDLTNLAKARLGAGVVGKQVKWDAYIHEVNGDNDAGVVFVWLKSALSADPRVLARFLDGTKDIDFFASLRKNQWVSVNCLVMSVGGPLAEGVYQLDCQELNLVSTEELTKQTP